MVDTIMRTVRRLEGVGLVALAGLLGLGCGLAEDLEKLRTLGFQLPSRSYSVNTQDARWRNPPPGGVPQVRCGPGGLVDANSCCTPPAPAPAIDCMQYPLSCEMGSCALKFRYEQASLVDLAKDVPALSSIKGSILSDVTVTRLDLTIANSMNVMLPPVTLYVAPANVTSASDGSARQVAVVPAKPPGYTGMEQIPLDAAAQAAIADFVRDFQTPFNIIAATDVVLSSGTPLPSGKLDVTVSGRVEAKF